MTRRRARLFAVQAIYAFAMDGSPIEAILKRLPHSGAARGCDDPFAIALCHRVCERLAEIDSELAAVVEHWRPERVAAVDRSLLRLGVCELLFFPDVPHRVTINEYVDLAKSLGDEQSPAFINGVLDKVLQRRHGETTQP